jgi:hypothetical protein
VPLPAGGVNVGIRVVNFAGFARDARANAEFFSLTQKTLPKRVSGKSVVAKIRNKTNDLLHSLFGIRFAARE